MKSGLKTILVGMGCVLVAHSPLAAAEYPIGEPVVKRTGIYWNVLIEHQGLTLSVRGRDCVLEDSFRSGEIPKLDPVDFAGEQLEDGRYAWELRATPVIDSNVRQLLAAARKLDDPKAEKELAQQLRREGRIPWQPITQTGYFTLDRGLILLDEPEDRSPKETAAEIGPKTGGLIPTTKDFVIADDLIVDGSACIGFDCVNGESFGFDTIRLKENNLRIKFDDTSTSAGFPSRDWQLTANDSASGGASKFSIEDITGARVPFTLEAGSPTNSLFVDDGGRVGLGTATPVVEIHTVDGDTPTLRLEQDGSSGFTPQTWDVAGNEANFFVRDVTGGSRLPLRIRPGAPTSSIDVSASGDVGIGTASPAASLHVSGSDGSTQMRVTDASATAAVRTLLDLRNNGDVQFILRNTGSGENWQFLAFNNGFQISEVSTANIFSFLEGGDMQIPGAYTSTSDRNAKENIEIVDPLQVLDKVAKLPIATWNYKNQDALMRHMGPMAQDFFALFGLGNDDTRISVTDPSGVALAAIQGLYQDAQQRNSTIESLRQENAELKERLARLEALLGQ
ncbi:MAG: tail fiber domain-containing protein [Thermoanaerobaculia bacterium]|nr:tail fiber domain-containing protein [Thermoanaerobaculia bacterium]